MDIFDAKIGCKKCGEEMQKISVAKDRFNLRAVKCGKCGDMIVHPLDREKMEQYEDLKGKTFKVKLRMVGNSHAVSIPKEIVDFFNESRRQFDQEMSEIDNMVKLCFEDFGRLSLNFGSQDRRRLDR